MQNGSDRDRSGDRAWRVSAVASLVLLTAITAVISYEHAYSVFQAAHNTGLLAILGPVVPDLVIAVASVSLLAASRTGFPRPALATVALTVFVAVTVALNVAAGLRYGRGSALLAVLAPVGYLAGLHILASMMRRGRGGPEVIAPAAPDTADSCPHGVSSDVESAVRIAWEHQRDCLGEPVTYRALGDRFGLDRRKVAAIVAPAPAPPLSPAGAGVNGDGPHA